jgi:hypothetical protein
LRTAPNEKYTKRDQPERYALGLAQSESKNRITTKGLNKETLYRYENEVKTESLKWQGEKSRALFNI